MAQPRRGLMNNLDEWTHWTRSQRRALGVARTLKHRVRPAVAAAAQLHRPAGDIHVVVVAEKFTPSCRAAGLEPLRHLDPDHTAVISSASSGIDNFISGLDIERYTDPVQLGSSVRAVLSLGAYLELSGPVEEWAARHDVPFFLVQHGLLTPLSPPASRGARVLAWCDSDAAYWAAGRPDIHVDVVSSQMLWEASQGERVVESDERPVMLGQLHGTELRRHQALRAYWAYCREGGMLYRPHPNEDDLVSRGLHEVMRRGGVAFETSGVPLTQLGRPVVSVFSTGTLEAAMRGLPAWVAHPDPAPWVVDFWERYGLVRWGGDPTPAWNMPDEAPAQAVARIVEAA